MQKHQLLSAINPLVAHPHWEYMVTYLDTLIENDLNQLSGCTSWEMAQELQGRVKAYRAIRALKDTINAEKLIQAITTGPFIK